MKFAKHLLYVLSSYARKFSCKHEDLYIASCPFTGMTYTTCERCLTRMKVEKTDG
jgi:uncharacterized metal-binding protein YceD (DUF177 family)